MACAVAMFCLFRRVASLIITACLFASEPALGLDSPVKPWVRLSVQGFATFGVGLNFTKSTDGSNKVVCKTLNDGEPCGSVSQQGHSLVLAGDKAPTSYCLCELVKSSRLIKTIAITDSKFPVDNQEFLEVDYPPCGQLSGWWGHPKGLLELTVSGQQSAVRMGCLRANQIRLVSSGENTYEYSDPQLPALVDNAFLMTALRSKKPLEVVVTGDAGVYISTHYGLIEQGIKLTLSGERAKFRLSSGYLTRAQRARPITITGGISSPKSEIIFAACRKPANFNQLCAPKLNSGAPFQCAFDDISTLVPACAAKA